MLELDTLTNNIKNLLDKHSKLKVSVKDMSYQIKKLTEKNNELERKQKVILEKLIIIKKKLDKDE
jgi:hypothetical protein